MFTQTILHSPSCEGDTGFLHKSTVGVFYLSMQPTFPTHIPHKYHIPASYLQIYRKYIVFRYLLKFVTHYTEISHVSTATAQYVHVWCNQSTNHDPQSILRAITIPSLTCRTLLSKILKLEH